MHLHVAFLEMHFVSKLLHEVSEGLLDVSIHFYGFGFERNGWTVFLQDICWGNDFAIGHYDCSANLKVRAKNGRKQRPHHL
jgi:hypothetical protein